MTEMLTVLELRKVLYLLFSTYGKVIDVVALKTPKMRGQAHIVFSDIPGAVTGLRSLQGFEIFGKKLKISFAKGESRVVAIARGSAIAPS